MPAKKNPLGMKKTTEFKGGTMYSAHNPFGQDHGLTITKHGKILLARLEAKFGQEITEELLRSKFDRYDVDVISDSTHNKVWEIQIGRRKYARKNVSGASDDVAHLEARYSAELIQYRRPEGTLRPIKSYIGLTYEGLFPRLSGFHLMELLKAPTLDEVMEKPEYAKLKRLYEEKISGTKLEERLEEHATNSILVKYNEKTGKFMFVAIDL